MEQIVLLGLVMNYLFGFRGRIGRLQWWGGQCINTAIIMIIFMGIGFSVIFQNPDEIRAHTGHGRAGIGYTILAVCVLITWIHLSVTVKRYHDRDKSGLWYCVGFIPLIGAIWQLVECGFLPGTPGSNNYGPPDSNKTFGDYSDTGRVEARLNSIDAAIEAMKRERTANTGREQAQVKPVAHTRREPYPADRARPTTFGKRVR